MNEIFLDDGQAQEELFPFTLTRSAADIRIGILTIREKWEQFYQYKISADPKAGIPKISSQIIPGAEMMEDLNRGLPLIGLLQKYQHRTIKYPWQIFQWNGAFIQEDFSIITKGRKSANISSGNRVIQRENIFIEPGAKVEHALLNASTGPIYIAKNAEVMEGAMIRGPFALCEGAVVKMGAKIYGATVGPFSVAGGEIKNSVLFGFTNKSHDGYLGDSVLGYWCNLGAGTSNSNVKNNGREILMWSEAERNYLHAGKKCGCMMGDYSRTAINTTINTGTVIGTCSNIFGAGLTPKMIPSFSWGYSPIMKYEFEKAIQDIKNWKEFKGEILSDVEIQKLKHIFEKL